MPTMTTLQLKTQIPFNRQLTLNLSLPDTVQPGEAEIVLIISTTKENHKIQRLANQQIREKLLKSPVDHFRKQNKKNTFLWKLLNSDDELCISVITEFEFYCGCKTLQRKNEAREVLDAFDRIVFDSFHSLRASEIYNELRATNQLLDILDILIAGFASNLLTGGHRFQEILRNTFPNCIISARLLTLILPIMKAVCGLVFPNSIFK